MIGEDEPMLKETPRLYAGCLQLPRPVVFVHVRPVLVICKDATLKLFCLVLCYAVPRRMQAPVDAGPGMPASLVLI